ncbi:hypothetical protein [Umezawaea tangerina]|uniref:Homeodomain-like domain-containing protein n=1 Tax=Umezawaea tangerina TaxID=84725 RepID=A0A2T0TKW6_9PSEU|nr:hypothetical protein [Umezawaea tangerina]PRY46354.1 hypothetical protein CLV43_101630 [Umezawaea tangerina]
MPRENADTVNPELLEAVTALADAERHMAEQTEALTRARAARLTAHAHRDALIHAELSRNVRVVELCKITGLTRARIYQIRENKPQD